MPKYVPGLGSIKSVISEMMKLEGEKVQVNRAQMTEIVRKLSQLCAEQPQVSALLTLHGLKQIKK